MNLPNALTTLRMLLIPFFLLVFLSDMNHSNAIACFIFIVASFTDFLDGALARKYHLITNFGKIMDPLADKLLVLSALIALTVLQRIPIWVVIIILARELGITGLRAVAAGEGVIISAHSLGKIKTSLQMVAIIFLILNISFGLPLIYIAVVLTIVSAADYIIKLSKKIRWM